MHFYCSCNDCHHKIFSKLFKGLVFWIVKEHHHNFPHYYKASNSYAIIAMWVVMRDVWCARLIFFVRSWLFESRGDQKYPIWVVSGLLSDIPKLTPGGSHMYTLSCKASYDFFELTIKTSMLSSKFVTLTISQWNKAPSKKLSFSQHSWKRNNLVLFSRLKYF